MASAISDSETLKSGQAENLVFGPNHILSRPRGLTFDDVLLVPMRSDVRSRRDPELSTQLTKKRAIRIPIMSANMDTVTGVEMAKAMAELGGFGPIHRFMSIDEQVEAVANVRKHVDGLNWAAPVGASVGVGDEARTRAAAIASAGADVIVVDIAHGHSVAMLEMISWIKSTFSSVEVIAGNLATGEAARELVEAGADAIKVGIGPGSMCTTRVITGCGVPQLTAIALAVEAVRGLGVPVIADGGLKTSGDIVKALAAGASSVMLGSMLAGTIETPGEIQSGRKSYRGMASKSAQVSWRGGVPEGMAAEGESRMVGVKGHVRDVVQEICGGLRSGMSYVNATRVSEIAEKARFIEMSPAGFRESHAHGLADGR